MTVVEMLLLTPLVGLIGASCQTRLMMSYGTSCEECVVNVDFSSHDLIPLW
jgi:hypothetical protein